MKKINSREVAEDEQTSPKGKYHLFRKHLSVALGATRDSTENQHVLQVVELGVVRDCAAEINAERFVNLRGARIALLQEGLNRFQSFGQIHICGDRNVRCGQQAIHRLLREIGNTRAAVARPFISRR